MCVFLRQECEVLCKLCLVDDQDFLVMIIGRQTQLTEHQVTSLPPGLADTITLGLYGEMAEFLRKL